MGKSINNRRDREEWDNNQPYDRSEDRRRQEAEIKQRRNRELARNKREVLPQENY